MFRDPLASLVGSPGYGFVLVIACANIPLVGFSSIQTAVFRRSFDFKTLFYVRLSALLVPLVVTVPFAFFLRNFWALVIGTLAKNNINAVVLSYCSSWKPIYYYSLQRLKGMVSFSIWSMVETMSIWMNQYIDVFFVGAVLSQYYLGLYKTSMAIVGQILGLVTVILTPVFFSTLSRLQNDDIQYKSAFFKFQINVATLILPIGFFIFAEKELFTQILLGEQWIEATGVVGLWGLCGGISIATTRYCSEMY